MNFSTVELRQDKYVKAHSLNFVGRTVVTQPLVNTMTNADYAANMKATDE